MKTASSLIIAIFVCCASGCAVVEQISTRISGAQKSLEDTIEFRQELIKHKQKLREAELEAQRQELELLRRAELKEISQNQTQTVPQLTSVLASTLNQKIVSMRMVPDYAAMAKTAEIMARAEEENDRIYQEELQAWLKQEADYQRQQARLASFRRPLCPKHHRHDCDCPKEPDCAKPPPPRAPVQAPPRKPVISKLPVQYKIELQLEQNVEHQEFIEAKPSRAPVKEKCASAKGCGSPDCPKCKGQNLQKRQHWQKAFNYFRQHGSGDAFLDDPEDNSKDEERANPPAPTPDVESSPVSNPGDYFGSTPGSGQPLNSVVSYQLSDHLARWPLETELQETSQVYSVARR